MPASLKHPLWLAAFGVLAALLTIEVSVRVFTHSLFSLHGFSPGDGIITDPRLGRVIGKTGSGKHPTKGFTVSIGDHGTRLNGGTPPSAVPPLILAVGDSFAFGDGVSDADTWPAVLERRTGRRVVNGGMIGFGLDQAVLRAEQLAAIYAPETIVVGFIPHDVLRCEMSYWSGFSKPYFEVAPSGELRLQPAEIPPRSISAALKHLLTYSVALDVLFPAFLHWQGPRELRAHHQGREVACLLMKRLEALGRGGSRQVVVLAHPQELSSPPEQREIKDHVLACAAARNLVTLDLFPIFDALPPAQREPLFDRHFTAEGYRLVGHQLADLLERIAPPPGTFPAAR